MIAGAVLAAVILGGPAIGPPRPSCGCAPSVTGDGRMWMVAEAARWEAVFIGFVARVDTRAWIPPASDTALFRGGLEVMSSCDPPLQFGRTYLLFAAKTDEPGYYQVTHCLAAELHRVTDVVDSLDRRRWPN